MSAVPDRAYSSEWLRSERRDPLPIPAALCHRCPQSAAESRAASCDRMCCPSSPHTPTAAHRWSPPRRLPVADNPVSYPGCNRAWPSGSAPSLLRSRCWSDRTAAPQNQSETSRPISVSTRQTASVCAAAPGRGSDIADPWRPRRNPFPTTRPLPYPHTIAGVDENHCRHRADSSLPVAAIPFPSSLPRALLASAAAKIHLVRVHATIRTPASKRRRSEGDAIQAAQFHLDAVQHFGRHFPVIREQTHGSVVFSVFIEDLQ